MGLTNSKSGTKPSSRKIANTESSVRLSSKSRSNESSTLKKVKFNETSEVKQSRFLHIIHFNDARNLNSAYSDEPRGGARKFATAVKQYKQTLAEKSFCKPLVLFSGNFVGPSPMSSFTQGAHLIEALNAIGTDFGTFGSHELDYGYDTLKSRLLGIDDDVYDGEVEQGSAYEVSETRWIMTNMMEIATGLPLGGSCVSKHALFEWGGEYGTSEKDLSRDKSKPIKVGILAVSENWLSMCSQLPTNVILYEDYIKSAKKAALLLRRNGAEIVIAITQNSLASDYKLTESVPEIDLLLGGCDHFLKEDIQGSRIIKSGEEWRWLSQIRIELKPGAVAPIVTFERKEITSDLVDNAFINTICDKYDAIVTKKSQQIIFSTALNMNPTKEFVRHKESALCNWVCDICCDNYSLQEGFQAAEICFLQGQNFAGKAMILAGAFKLADLFNTFPIPIKMVMVKMSGQQVIESLTIGAQLLPEECGTIHHVSSSLTYSIALTNPPTTKDVLYRGKAIDANQMFRVILPDSMLHSDSIYPSVKAELIIPTIFAHQLQDLVIMYCKRNKSIESCNPANPTMGRIKITQS